MKNSGALRYWINYRMKRPIIEKLYSLCCALQGKFANGAKFLECHAYGPAIHYERPTKAEREERSKNLRIGTTVVLAAAALIAIISWFAKYYFTVLENNLSFDEWNSSAGSFWGAVLGAAIAGIFTVCTTILVIQRSYKIDYHRERLDALPVLDMKVFLEQYKMTENVEKDLQRRAKGQIRDFLIAFGASNIGENVRIYTIKNIGAGIAYNIQTSNFYSEEFEEAFSCGILPQEDTLLLAASNKSHGEVFLTFFDLYENKYCQKYSLCQYGGRTQITTYPPELIRKTQRIRYTQ